MPPDFLLALDVLLINPLGFGGFYSSDTGQKGLQLSTPKTLLHKNKSEKLKMGRKTESLHSLQSLICLRSSVFLFVSTRALTRHLQREGPYQERIIRVYLFFFLKGRPLG